MLISASERFLIQYAKNPCNYKLPFFNDHIQNHQNALLCTARKERKVKKKSREIVTRYKLESGKCQVFWHQD